MDYQTLYGCFIATVGVGIVAFLVRFIIELLKYYKATDVAKRAVKAAEMLFNVPKTGPEKKQWVKDKIREVIKASWLTDSMLEILIEAACREMKKEEIYELPGAILEAQVSDTLKDDTAGVDNIEGHKLE